MKNTRYFPFERNHYFYGKLLTVRDFDSEQKYMNDKRRLLNRLLHGVGVVSGLQVIAVDDTSISVEMGIAVDGLGREIVVASPLTLKLSTMEGFSNNDYAKNVYLCICYDEKGKEPVHAVSNSTSQDDQVSEFNRLAEGYKLFIKEEPPTTRFNIIHLTESRKIIYEDSQVRIVQKSPKYVNVGETFAVEVIVEKAIQTPKIKLSYTINSEQFIAINQNEDGKAITFIEPADKQEVEYKATYFLKSANVNANDTGIITIKKDEVELQIGDRAIEIVDDITNEIQVIDGSIKKQIMNDYFNQSFEQMVDPTKDDTVYLAKISLMQMGPTYMIEKIDPIPFNQYVFNATTLHQIEEATEKASSNKFLTKTDASLIDSNAAPYLDVNYDFEKSLFHFSLGLPKSKTYFNEIATDTIELKLSESGQGKRLLKKNKTTYISDEIEHGLGLGPVYIELAIEEKNSNTISDMMKTDEKLFFGDFNVFDESEYEVEYKDISLGSILYPKKGTFQIGIKAAINSKEDTELRIRWYAFRMSEREE